MQKPSPDRVREYLGTRLKRKDSVIYIAEMPAKGDLLVGFVQLYPLLDSLRLGNIWLLNDL